MNDQFPPDQNSAKADFVVPEAGPGEKAAGFSAKVQREKFLGGSSGNPPEASKGFLGKVTRRAREAAIAFGAVSVPGGMIAYGLRKEGLAREAEMARAGLTAKPEIQPTPESKELTPTEASDSFLEMTKQIIKKDWTYILPITVGAVLATGIDAPLVAKGLVAGASLVPFALKTFRRG